ncbi:MAG: hypothetical protein Q4C87_06805 [Actinomycetaceae bacterium]|nr:hypothetical protein [Actinomycetaceae bacterium]
MTAYPSSREIFDTVDWAHLVHAYSPDEQAEQAQALETLLGDDRDAMAAATSALDGAFFHQSTLFPAGGPAFAVAIAALDEWGPDAPRDAITEKILSLLAEIADEDLVPYQEDIRSHVIDEQIHLRVAEEIDLAVADDQDIDYGEFDDDMTHESLAAAQVLLANAPRAVEVIGELARDMTNTVDLLALETAALWTLLLDDAEQASASADYLRNLAEQIPADVPESPAIKGRVLATLEGI